MGKGAIVLVLLSLLPSILSNLGFGISALIFATTATSSDIAACNALQDTNYTGLFLGQGIVYVDAGGILVLVSFCLLCSVQCGAYGLLLSRIVNGMGGIAAFVLAIIGSVRTWQAGWADLSCMSTTLWYWCHSYYIATWVVSGTVCIFSFISSVACGRRDD